MKSEIKLYKNGSLEVPVTVSPEENTVWLNRSQLAILFDRDIKTIGKHINNALKEELDSSVVAKIATTGALKGILDSVYQSAFNKNACFGEKLVV